MVNRCRVLNDYANTRVVFVDSPSNSTHFDVTDRPDVLNIVPLVHQLFSVSELNSDHSPVLLYLGEKRDGSVERTTIVSWSAFEYLRESMVPVLHTQFVLAVMTHRNGSWDAMESLDVRMEDGQSPTEHVTNGG